MKIENQLYTCIQLLCDCNSAYANPIYGKCRVIVSIYRYTVF